MSHISHDHWHPSVLGTLWIADVVLLLVIWPAGGPAPLGAVLVMWLVPTLVLAVVTWWWLRRHHGLRRSP